MVLQRRDEDSFHTLQSVPDCEKLLLFISQGNAFLCVRYDSVTVDAVAIRTP